ncbi:MAG: cation transporter, partial [Clostridia bacterium]|nr:cation transporter [Clostridia bacterium]
MKSDKRIGIAFVLNLAFALLEAAGGWLTGSVAVLSDAVHDLGDALGIGVSFLLERKSRRAPDGRYTYGYARYSVLSGIVTSLVLLCGASVCIVSSVHRLFHP